MGDPAQAMNITVEGEHAYMSTSCYHGHHDLCRLICKYCPAKCLCKCHGLMPAMYEGPGTARPTSAAERSEPL